MQLRELTKGEVVKIRVVLKQGESSFENYYSAPILYTAEELGVTRDAIFIEPITHGDKVLNLSIKGINIDLSYTTKDGMFMEWRGCCITKISYKDQILHAVVATVPGQKVNRRGSYRVSIGEPGIAVVAPYKKGIDVMVKDISVKGFSFVVKGDTDYALNSVVHLNFKDEKANVMFSLTGKIVRQQEVENDRIVYGCYVEEDIPAIHRYIASKQREEAARKSKMR